MKKTVCLLLIITLLLSCFVGCSESGQESTAEPTEPTSLMEQMENPQALSALVDHYEAGEGSFTLGEGTRLFAVTQEAEGELAEFAAFSLRQLEAAQLLPIGSTILTYGSRKAACPVTCCCALSPLWVQKPMS